VESDGNKAVISVIAYRVYIFRFEGADLIIITQGMYPYTGDIREFTYCEQILLFHDNDPEYDDKKYGRKASVLYLIL